MTEEEQNTVFMLDCIITLKVAERKKAKQKEDEDSVRIINQHIQKLMHQINSYKKEELHYYGA